MSKWLSYDENPCEKVIINAIMINMIIAGGKNTPDTKPVRSKYYFDKLTYDINVLASKFLKKAICSIFTSLSCFILVT